MPDLLSPDILLNAYASGIFPMGDDQYPGEIAWYDPDPRGVLPIGGFRASRSLLRQARRDDVRFALNRDFSAVLKGCAGRPSTWITTEIAAAYLRLYHLGWAHSAEVLTSDGQLIGGLYGVAIGRAFFGESMFSAATGGSKMALGCLMAMLESDGFTLFDTQYLTTHLASLGAREIRRKAYHQLLREAVKDPKSWHPQVIEARAYSLLQRTSQMS